MKSSALDRLMTTNTVKGAIIGFLTGLGFGGVAVSAAVTAVATAEDAPNGLTSKSIADGATSIFFVAPTVFALGGAAIGFGLDVVNVTAGVAFGAKDVVSGLLPRAKPE